MCLKYRCVLVSSGVMDMLGTIDSGGAEYNHSVPILGEVLHVLTIKTEGL